MVNTGVALENIDLSATEIYAALKNRQEVKFYLGEVNTPEYVVNQDQLVKLIQHLHVLKSKDRSIHEDLQLDYTRLLIHTKAEQDRTTKKMYMIIFSVEGQPERKKFNVSIIP